MNTTDRAVYIAHDTKLVELNAELGKALTTENWAWAAHERAEADERCYGHHDPERYAAATEAAYNKATAAHEPVNAARAAIRKHEENYTGWNRYFLVTNVGGHIHRTMDCTTCYPTTMFHMLVDLAAKDAAEAVAEEGEVLCTICFPDAPVEWTNGTRNATKAEREARAKAKAERDAAKLAKALMPDGTGVRVLTGYGTDTITTIAAAKAFLTDDFAGEIGYDTHTPRPDRNRIAELLADRTDDTVEGVLNAAKERAVKRTAKEVREAENGRFNYVHFTEEAKAENAARLDRVKARLAAMKATLR